MQSFEVCRESRPSHEGEHMAAQDEPMRHLPLNHDLASSPRHDRILLTSARSIERRSRLLLSCFASEDPRFFNSASHFMPNGPLLFSPASSYPFVLTRESSMASPCGLRVERVRALASVR
jgi:hypothetical protein